MDSAPTASSHAQLPVTEWLKLADTLAPEAMLEPVAKLRALSGFLRWQQTYTADDLGQRFLDRYGWTMLVGPDAPITCDNLLAGFMLLGPDVEYPVQSHSAEEVYVVLSGTASWKVGKANWQAKKSGCVIHNPPWQLHGMRTDHGQPLLVGFMWNAGAVEKSRLTVG